MTIKQSLREGLRSGVQANEFRFDPINRTLLEQWYSDDQLDESRIRDTAGRVGRAIKGVPAKLVSMMETASDWFSRKALDHFYAMALDNGQGEYIYITKVNNVIEGVVYDRGRIIDRLIFDSTAEANQFVNGKVEEGFAKVSTAEQARFKRLLKVLIFGVGISLFLTGYWSVLGPSILWLYGILSDVALDVLSAAGEWIGSTVSSTGDTVSVAGDSAIGRAVSGAFDTTTQAASSAASAVAPYAKDAGILLGSAIGGWTLVRTSQKIK